MDKDKEDVLEWLIHFGTGWVAASRADTIASLEHRLSMYKRDLLTFVWEKPAGTAKYDNLYRLSHKALKLIEAMEWETQTNT